MISHIQNSLSGSNTIRIYGRSQEFIEANYNHINNHIFAIQVYEGVNSWFAIRIDILSVLLMAVISTACVFLRTDVSQEDQESISLSGLTDKKEVIEPVLLSMLLSYVLTIQTTLVYVLKFYVQIESNMINAERCMNLVNIIQEQEIIGQELTIREKFTVADGWPKQGAVEFKNVSLRYRP